MYLMNDVGAIPKRGGVYAIADSVRGEFLWLGETANLNDRSVSKHYHGHLDQGIKQGMIDDGTARDAADAKAKIAHCIVIPLLWEIDRAKRREIEANLRPFLRPKYGKR